MSEKPHKGEHACKFCGRYTFNHDKTCDPCWEVRMRIQHINVEVLNKILDDLNFTPTDMKK